MQAVTFAGFESLQFDHAGTRLIVTTEIGPRILSYGFTGEANLLLVRPEHAGVKGGGYRSYGGHRLWIAPEDRERTTTPDSDPVAQHQEGAILFLSSATDRFHIQKSMGIEPVEGGFKLHHRVINQGADPVDLSPWAITVMNPGGVCRIPQEPLRPQAENLLPVRPVVLWNYTDMSDPRYTWGRETIELRSTEDPNPTKFGAFVSQGWAEYQLGTTVFRKEFPAGAPADYPDLGCNFESYTRAGMLEVESLGPLVCLKPGDSVTHTERWSLRHQP